MRLTVAICWCPFTLSHAPQSCEDMDWFLSQMRYSLFQFYEEFLKGVLDMGDKFVLDDRFRNYDVRVLVSESTSPSAAQ